MYSIFRQIHAADTFGRLRLVDSQLVIKFPSILDAYAWCDQQGIQRWQEFGGELVTSDYNGNNYILEYVRS